MSCVTDFVVKAAGSPEVVIRHTAQNVEEFLSLEDDYISDIYGHVYVRRSEIVTVQESYNPYVVNFLKEFCYIPSHHKFELQEWLSTKTAEEKEEMKIQYYDK